MSAKPITVELYDTLSTYLLDHPADIVKAARGAGCVYRTAKRAWELGWPKTRDHALFEPIKDVYARRQAMRREVAADLEASIAAKRARADLELGEAIAKAGAEAEAIIEHSRVRAKGEAERILAEARARVSELNDVAQVDALETQAQEIALVRSTRAFLLWLKEVLRQCMQGGKLERALVQSLNVDLTLTPKAAVQLLKDLAWLGRAISEAEKWALENERLRVGEPTSVVQVQIEQMSDEEAIQRLQPLDRLGKLIQQRRLARPADPPEDSAIEVDEAAAAPAAGSGVTS
jgi:hypothetical protein